jgi:hypothetical protein
LVANEPAGNPAMSTAFLLDGSGKSRQTLLVQATERYSNATNR